MALFVSIAACGGSPGGGDDKGPGSDGGSGQYTPPYANCSGNDMSQPPGGSLCLDDPTAPPTDPPLAVIEQSFVDYMGTPAIYLRIVFDPRFVDNTYGTTAVGWDHHNFKDLVGSDHAEVVMLDATGATILDFNLDYISPDPTAPCGFRCLGVDGGEGGMLTGDRAAILAYSSSLDRNINERGYCDFLTNSPMTDANCTPDPAAPNWDFRVVYEVWVRRDAFDPSGFGSAYMSFVHASPSKYPTNTVTVQPGDCPCVEIDINTCDAPPPGGGCTMTTDCPTEQFCYNMQCIPKIL